MNRKDPKNKSKMVVLFALVGTMALTLALSLFLAPAAAHIPSNASLFNTVQARPFPIDNAMPSALAPSDCGSSADGCRSITAETSDPSYGYRPAQTADLFKSPSTDNITAETSDPDYGYRPAQADVFDPTKSPSSQAWVIEPDVTMVEYD